jgi:hypothetical protein
MKILKLNEDELKELEEWIKEGKGEKLKERVEQS